MSVDVTVNTTETNVNINASTVVETIDIIATVQQDAVEIDVFPNVTVVNVTKKEGEDGQDGVNGVDGTDGQDGQDLTLSDFSVAPEASALNDTDRFLIEQGGVWKGLSKTNLIVNIPDATQIVRGFVNSGTQTFKGNKTIIGESSTVGNAFEVNNSSLTSLVNVMNNGNVGIGIGTPLSKLSVNGDIRLQTSQRIIFDSNTTNFNYLRFNGGIFTLGYTADSIKFDMNTSSIKTIEMLSASDFQIKGANNKDILITPQGLGRLKIIVPTSATGLTAGCVWNDGGTLRIVT